MYFVIQRPESDQDDVHCQSAHKFCYVDDEIFVICHIYIVVVCHLLFSICQETKTQKKMNIAPSPCSTYVY